MDPDPIFPDSYLKHILEHVRFDQRASIALHIPSLIPLESTVPLRLDYFHFEDLSMTIDTVSYDFYEFWNFPISSPPSKQEVERIRDQIHFGNLFFRKIDSSGRWEKKIPLGLTQGQAETKFVNYLFGRFEKVEVRRLRIDDVEDFLRRIGEGRKGRILMQELHVAVKDHQEFEKICDFLHPGSFPLKKLEMDAGNLMNLDLKNEKINQVKNLRINSNSNTSHTEIVGFLECFLSLSHEPGTILQLEVPGENFMRSALDFIKKKFRIENIQLGTTTTIENGPNSTISIFCGQVEQYKRHIFDIMETSYWWIIKLEFL